MAQKDLKDLTIQELEKRAKSLKTFAMVFLIVLMILTCVSVFLAIKDSESHALIIIPIALFPFLLIMAGAIRKINSEISSRKNP